MPVLNARLRHPLCPGCGYDLVATVQAGRRRCPECGDEFELDELRHQVRPGDWTLLVGLRMTARTLAWRSAATVIAWGAICALTIWLLQTYPVSGIVLWVAAVGGGCLSGFIFSRRLFEAAGFDSWIVVVGACVGAALALFLGLAAVETVLPLSSGFARFMLLGLAVFAAWVWIVHSTVIESL
ncbi:MAG: hypothetical protein L0Y42_06270 [Phycisphaerales bacterium]|nr:hypothetical protein [Phycisphaerales bacterium]